MERPIVTDIPATPHFDFLSGLFHLSKWQIPYFSTTLSLAEAAQNLKLAPDLPGAETIEWRIDELFQRDINWPRVENQIVPYLNNTEVPQFFNALTIALLPFDSHDSELKDTFDDDFNWIAPPLTQSDRFARTTTVGPLTLGFWNDWSTPTSPGFRSGQLRWNPEQVFGVAIDGQHRLAAIKSLQEQSSNAERLHDSRVPVILLVFDKRLGFESPGHHRTVDTLRKLFIDLNKHAQTVSRARQILLDDRDPHAKCVRSLVGEQLLDNANDLLSVPPRLPLALVDWHSEQAKFDEGPYVTTVLGLDSIISAVLNTRPIADFTDYRAVDRQITAIESRLQISLPTAREQLEDVSTIKLSPFTYDDETLEQIEERFREVWSGPICRFLGAPD